MSDPATKEMVKQLSNAARQLEALDVLMSRAEKTMYVIGEMYCTDHLGGGVDPEAFVDTVYAAVVRQEEPENEDL